MLRALIARLVLRPGMARLGQCGRPGKARCAPAASTAYECEAGPMGGGGSIPAPFQASEKRVATKKGHGCHPSRKARSFGEEEGRRVEGRALVEGAAECGGAAERNSAARPQRWRRAQRSLPGARDYHRILFAIFSPQRRALLFCPDFARALAATTCVLVLVPLI